MSDKLDKVTVKQFRESLIHLMAQADDLLAYAVELEKNEVFKAYEPTIVGRKQNLSTLMRRWIEQSERVMKMFNELMERAKEKE